MLEHAYEPSSWLPYLLIVANLLSSLAWPVAAFALIFTFRKQLRDLIPNIENLAAPGVSIGLRKGQGETATLEGSVKPDLVKLAPNALRSPTLENIENSLKAEIEALPPEQRLPVTLTALAQARLEGTFNLAYANIFGSQIRALRMLNDRRKVSRGDAEKEFAELRAGNPALKDWTLDQYLNFLRHFLFINEVEGDFLLTDFGREFLAYLSRKGLSEDRAY